MDNDSFKSELYYLVGKYLKNGPCQETYKKFLEEVENLDLLPHRYDWTGQEHRQTFKELDRNTPYVGENPLFELCTRTLSVADNDSKKILKYEPSLLRNSSVNRSNEIGRKFFNLKSYLVRRHGIPLPEPITFRKHSIAKALYGREVSGPFNRKHMLAGCSHKNINLIGRTLGHLSPVYCILFDSSGRYIYTGADDSLVKVWHAISGRLLCSLRGASGEISDIAVNYENTLLAAGSVDKIVRVWCLQTAFPVATLVVHTGLITGVNFCPAIVNGYRYLASTSSDGSVTFWKYATNNKETNFDRSPVQFMERMRPGRAHILCGSFSPGGMFLATGSADHNVRIYKMAGPEGPTGILEEEAHQDCVDSIQWSHMHLRFASGSKDGTCLIWYYEQQTWKKIRLCTTANLPGVKVSEEDPKVKLRVTMLNWDKSDKWLITSSSDNLIRVWDAFTGQLIQVLNGHKKETYVIESHPLDSQILLSAGYDGKIFIWNIITAEILTSFENKIEGQGAVAIFDAKWSPDGTKFAATDSHGRILVYGIGLPDVTRKVPLALFFHTDYRPLTRDMNNVVLDEQTQIPPHLMPPPFLVDMDGNPYPPYLQRLVPGREHCDVEQLIPNVVLDDEGQQEVIMEVSDEGFHMQNDTMETSRRGSVAMRGNGLREGVRHSSGNWQRGDNISWTKRLICKPLDKYSVQEMSQKIQFLSSFETSEFIKESKKPLAPEPVHEDLIPKKMVKRKKILNHSYRTRASRTEELVRDENNELSSGDSQDENEETAQESAQIDSTSSSSDNDSSSEYSDWTADHGKNKLEPPKRVARVRNVRRVTKIKKIVSDSIKKPAPKDIPEEYRPSEWLAETMPKKSPYYPQMGDEVMFFQQGYNLYLDAVQSKNIYKIKPAQLNPWGKIKLKEPQHCKVVGIKYEIRPPRLCGLRLTVMNENNESTSHSFHIKYHDITDVIDFLVLKQVYDTAMSRNWKVGDRFRSAIDDAWWCGKILARNRNAQSPFLCYKIRWDNNEDENLSPWDLEQINPRREPPSGQSVPIMPREMKNILYRPDDDEWSGNSQDAACDRVLGRLGHVMSMAIAEHFLAPVDISLYPSYAYVVEYPIDLNTIKARFENRFYRRLTAAQFDARYIASNAEKFNERGSDIVKHARIITDLLLRIMRDDTHLPLDVPALCRQLQENYNSTDSTEAEDEVDINVPGPSNQARPLRSAASKNNATRRRSARNTQDEPFDWKVKCKELLQLLWRNDDGTPFREPVDRLEHPDYDKVIDTPMDLGIIREELKGNNYDSPEEFWRDLKIMFNNAKNYTPNKRSRIYGMTVRLSNLAEEQMKMILRSNREMRPRRGIKRSCPSSSIDNATSDEDINRASTNFSGNRRPRRIVKDSPRKMKPSAVTTRSPRKAKEEIQVAPSSESDSSSDDKTLQELHEERLMLSGHRSLRTRKTRNYAEMLHTHLSSDDTAEEDKLRGIMMRQKRGRRRKLSLEERDGSLVASSSSGGRLRRNVQVRHYNENLVGSDEDDDAAGLAIELSVSSRGRTRRLTAKARASVFSVSAFRRGDS